MLHLTKIDMNEPTVYKNYFERYTSLVKEKDLRTALINQTQTLDNFFESITEEKAAYAYAEGKWTLKEMLQHMIDTERIFTYRALAIARKETATLPGYDENLYAANSAANNRSWNELKTEMNIVRKSTTILFNSFNTEMLSSTGNFSTLNATTETLGFILIGHFYHHVNIANQRYLS